MLCYVMFAVPVVEGENERDKDEDSRKLDIWRERRMW